MTDPEMAVVTSAGAGVLYLARWAVGLWAAVRREDIAAAKETAALQRAESARMVDALQAQARSNAELGGKLEALSAKLETLVAWRERAPVEAPSSDDDTRPGLGSERRRRIRTKPEGFRSPKPGEHND